MSAGRTLAILPSAVAIVFAAPAAGADGTPAGLPTRADQILFVGDSVTAGMYYFAHCDEWAEQGWAGQLMRRLGMEPDRPRLAHPFPVDQLVLTRNGLGFAGWRYPWNALPALRRRHPRFAAGEPRSIVAVPGQTLGEILRESSEHHGSASTGWVLGAFLLPAGQTSLETAELSARDPEWVVFFAGGNDALSYFGMVGAARPAAPEAFAADYAEAVSRLRARMRAGSSSRQLLVVTIPDVTQLPFLQPLPAGATDGRGKPFPAGTVTSAFLRPVRGGRFEREEVWTPSQLAEIRELIARYNSAIRDIADRNGYTVVDVAALTAELAEDPRFGTPDSPYFSPDLHHPSDATHGRIAERVLEAMSRVAGVSVPPAPPDTVVPLPTNSDFSPDERARVDLLMRLSLLTAQAGHFPPRPTARLGVETSAGLGASRAGDAVIATQVQLESSPGPVTSHWVSRGVVGVRAAAAFSSDDSPRLPEEARDVRAGIALEPLGHWAWLRGEAGLRYGWAGGLSWYARGEWRWIRFEAGGDPAMPARAELGVGLDWLVGRPGHNGN